jgi:glycosyltransferase involved in cell wall biosynthesis
MNILIVTPYPPVLHVHGGGVRMFHNIRILAERHNVRVISFVENDAEVELLKSVEAVCESVASVRRVLDLTPHWFSLAPFMVREFGTPAMHEAVDRSLRMTKIDVIQCEYLQMAQYRRPGIFSILTAHEAYSANAYKTFQTTTDTIEKLRAFNRWMAMLNYEISMCNAFDRVVTMTEADAAYLRSYAPHANIRAIPIGIDADHFRPAVDRSCDYPTQIVFVGNFRHSPNVEAAEFLLKEVAPHFPDTTFVIAGSYLPQTIPKPSNAIFSGYIADTRELFHPPGTIFAAPLFSGTGQRVKLLEAFAMRAASVTTSVGASGFPIAHGEQALIANTAEEFRTAIAALLASPELRIELGKKARQMIEDHFTWNTIGNAFLQLVEHRCDGL